MRIERNLADGYKYITSNNHNDFYIRKIADNRWFTYCMEKGTNINTAMADFRTQKSAIKCASIWAIWLK